ncbi:MAG: DNA-protecting protein DprA [Solirubrobacterales bacterium]|nr:DNA-protecting protein DprA [Solirubrobacterales bacterium]
MALIQDLPPTRYPTAHDVRSAGGARALLEQRHGLFAGEREAQAAARLEEWRGRGIAALPYNRHPPHLSRVADRPALIFISGELADDDGVAVIGTRRPTRQGLESAEMLTAALVQAGITVVSGLAAGIDTVAHRTALQQGGRTVAVLGNGHDHSYPPANSRLQEAVHVTVSQFPPAQPPTRETFPLRNAVMSALSAATVIVEAGERSGARIQARHALAQGRPLLLFVPLLRQAWARTLASKAGVRVITNGQELIDAL